METIEIVASRFRMSLYLALSLAFVALGLWLADDPALRWATAFFALCAGACAFLLWRPQRLTLDQEGFALTGGLARSPMRVAWRDVGEFMVLGGPMIGFDYLPDATDTPRGAALASQIAGAQGALPGNWSRPTRAVVDQLNACRARAFARSDG